MARLEPSKILAAIDEAFLESIRGEAAGIVNREAGGTCPDEAAKNFGNILRMTLEAHRIAREQAEAVIGTL